MLDFSSIAAMLDITTLGSVIDPNFIINMLLAATLSQLLAFFYVAFGNSLSNRSDFSKNFVLLSTTTMLVIFVVQSSLELSLGLIGALSIVRFRAAIKEPEELAYLFLTIAIGLGFGANHRAITIVAFITILALLLILRTFGRSASAHNAYVTITGSRDTAIQADQIHEIIQRNSKANKMKRIEKSENGFEVISLFTPRSDDSFTLISKAVLECDPKLNVSFVDNTI